MLDRASAFFQDVKVEPFTREQIEALIKACDRTRTWKARELTTNSRTTVERDQAIMLLLDTGYQYVLSMQTKGLRGACGLQSGPAAPGNA